MQIELVTETYAPDVNGVALTVQSLEQGLRALGHRVGIVRIARGGEPGGEHGADLRVTGSPLPGYPGLRFGLPASGRLQARWAGNRPDVVYIATEGPLGWSALTQARRLGIPVATGFHTRFDDYVTRYGARMLSPWVFAWMRRFHNRGDATLVPTRELQLQLQARGFRNVQRLGRAVDTEAFHPRWRSEDLRRAWGVTGNAPVVVSVGRLAAEKNLDLAITAFRELQLRLPAARMVLVGDGPERARLQAAHPDLVFTGMLQGAALSAHYASADLFLFPSLTDTFGNVTLEAMASGLACVAFDYGAAGEVLCDRLHGATVPYGDEFGFLDATVRVGLSSGLLRMGMAARAAVHRLSPLDAAREFADTLDALRQSRVAA
jgi:glycosyltransferase involved in cell wall biosynthesis